MPEIPAVCNRCGSVRERSGVNLENITVEGPAFAAGKCDCGGTYVVGDVAVQDGKVTYLRRAYGLLTQPTVAASDLRTLSRILEEAREKRENPEIVVASIQKSTPQLASITDVLVPNDPGSFWTMVAALIALVAMIRSWKKPPAEAPATVLNQIFLQAEGASGYRAGRNDPCPCGSGRKFKHCHGRAH